VEKVLFLMSLNLEYYMRACSSNLELENNDNICLKAEKTQENLRRVGQTTKECTKSTPDI
jgi:hypothetical protein